MRLEKEECYDMYNTTEFQVYLRTLTNAYCGKPRGSQDLVALNCRQINILLAPLLLLLSSTKATASTGPARPNQHLHPSHRPRAPPRSAR